jgi:hypothetical protein
MSKHPDEIVKDIAKEHLGLETLEAQGLDRLDFHDLSVWQIKKALQEAFYAGFKTGEIGHG